MSRILTASWTQLRWHEEQQRFWHSDKRFQMSPAGRRSGKSEIAKRKLIKRALAFNAYPDGWFVYAAPTVAQGKRIAWNHLKNLIPKRFLAGRPSESGLTIKLITGTEITVVGMDKPERVEGRPLDGIVLDEYGNMKANTWKEHVRPALSTPDRYGWAIFVGVPEGRNHYYNLWRDFALNPDKKDWGGYHWKSSEIIPEEAAAARADMDIQTYLQEYEGEFINFEGRAYYAFENDQHSPRGTRVYYDDEMPLIFCFDFNRTPGVALVCQEVKVPGWLDMGPQQKQGQEEPRITGAIDEVYIERNSTTEKVCERLQRKWKEHEGPVHIYGDASGGSRHSSSLHGSDWDIVRNVLGPHFGHRYKERFGRKNPPIRGRLNAVNSRLQSADGTIRMVVDSKLCPSLVKDFEGVECDSAGDIIKPLGTALTHISDGLGYYLADVFPAGGPRTFVTG